MPMPNIDYGLNPEADTWVGSIFLSCSEQIVFLVSSVDLHPNVMSSSTATIARATKVHLPCSPFRADPTVQLRNLFLTSPPRPHFIPFSFLFSVSHQGEFPMYMLNVLLDLV